MLNHQLQNLLIWMESLRIVTDNYPKVTIDRIIENADQDRISVKLLM